VHVDAALEDEIDALRARGVEVLSLAGVKPMEVMLRMDVGRVRCSFVVVFV
jgi:hypothetical protein